MKEKITILGTPYTVQILSPDEEPILKDCDGFCDKTSHRIVASTKADKT